VPQKIFHDVTAIQTLVDVLPVAIFVKDAQSKIRLMNKACEEQWGMRFSGLQGTDASHLFPANQMEWFLSKDREIFAGGCQVDFEEEFWNATLKQNRLGHTFKKPVYDNAGKPLYLICITIDITENRKTHQELRLSEEKLRILFEMSPLGIARNSMDGTFIEANDAFLKIVGYTLDELNQLSYWDLTPKSYEQQEALQLESLRTKAKYGPYDKEYINRDGHPVPVHLNGVQITGSDDEKYIWSLVEDFTERKRVAELLHNSSKEIEDLYNHAPCGYHSLDKNGLICRINDTELAWLGYTRDEVVGKMKLTDFLTPDGIHAFQRNFPQFIKLGAMSDLEFEIIRKDGTKFTGLINATAIYAPDGSFVMSRSTVLDITKRKQADEKNKKSEERLRESEARYKRMALHLDNVREEERVRIARELHDEMGATLTALKMRVHWLATRQPGERTRLSAEAMHMDKLVSEAIHTMRHVVSELMPTLLHDLGFPAAIENYVQDFQNHSGIDCRLAFPEEELMLDENQSSALFRILQESLNNVAKHAKATMVSILFIERNRSLIMVVKDNGLGFDFNKRKKNSFGTTGIKERSNMVNGKARISSKPGKGTLVLVSIPYH